MNVIRTSLALAVVMCSEALWAQGLAKPAALVRGPALSPVPADRLLTTAQFKEVYDAVAAGRRDAYLIDVRTHPEFDAGHIENTDHMPAGRVRPLLKLVPDRRVEIVLLCRTHNRSCECAAYLMQRGYTNVSVYEGGITGWIKAGHPLVNRFMGRFKVVDYQKNLAERSTDGKPRWRLRSFER